MLPLIIASQRACTISSSSSSAPLLVRLLTNAQPAWGCSTQQSHCQEQHACSLHQQQQQQPQQQQQQWWRSFCTPQLKQPKQLQRPLSRGFSTSQGLPPGKQLSDIMKLELLQHETPDTVEDIWMKFHASSDTHIGTVLSKDEHVVLCARAAASPHFVLPLSTAPGRFHTLLLQWQPPHRLLFTTLEEFKQWGPQAPPHLTVQLYEDLSSSHALVLARGDLLNMQLIGAAEGRTLLELARAFYRDAAAYRMVYAFNHNPQQFDFQQLCRELGVTLPPAAGGSPAA